MWRFKTLDSGEPERDPQETEFFNVGRLDPSTSLVRETIQNSLDARLDNSSPVRVRFVYSTHRYVSDDVYYDDLIAHLQSAGRLQQSFHENDKMTTLLIEDFNTIGLDGEITQRTSNYYNFWWREGKSQKEGTSGGRWGLGKTVFFASSGLRCYWGYTVRHDDARHLLLGKAVLGSHKHRGEQFKEYAYFSADEQGNPIVDRDELTNFKQKYDLSRDDESGLSIVVPVPVAEITAESIVRASILEYFFPIMMGRLEVEVVDLQGKSIELTQSTLLATAQRQDWEKTSESADRIYSLMQFAENAATVPESQTFELALHADTPRMEETLFSGKVLQKAKQHFADGRLLKFYVPVDIRTTNGDASRSHFTVFLKKDFNLKGADAHFIRSGISVYGPNMRRYFPGRGIRGLLYAEEEAVSEFLGDAETPAHTRWNERIDRFKKKYDSAVYTLRFIRGSVRDIAALLDEPEPGLKEDFLRDIFYVEDSASENGTQRTGSDEIEIKSTPRKFRFSKLRNGFSVFSNNSIEKGKTVELNVAYDTRGNPFSRYNPFDFNLAEGDIEIDIEGASLVSAESNRLILEATGAKMRVGLNGFDGNRDVISDIRVVDQ